MIRVIKCPLCEWTYQERPLDARINHDTLAGVFGPGVFAQHAINTRMQETEQALTEHFQTHPLAEWVRRVVELERAIERRECPECQGDGRELYVFLSRRPQDREAWPLVYEKRELAERAPGRVSPVVAVRVAERKTEGRS